MNLPKFLLGSILIIPMLTTSCEKENQKLFLSQNDTLTFSGTFKFTNTNTNLGTITLKAASNFYFCSTSLPFGHGAGNIILDESSIDFVDTLFLVIPALYGPSYVLSGKYDYQFDGLKLLIRTDKKTNNLIYDLQLDE